MTIEFSAFRDRERRDRRDINEISIYKLLKSGFIHLITFKSKSKPQVAILKAVCILDLSNWRLDHSDAEHLRVSYLCESGSSFQSNLKLSCVLS